MQENGNARSDQSAEDDSWRPHDSQRNVEVQTEIPAPPDATEKEPEQLSRLRILRDVLIGCVTVAGLLLIGAMLVNLMWYVLFRQ